MVEMVKWPEEQTAVMRGLFHNLLHEAKRMLVRTRCACCVKCWKYADTGVCVCGGPFTGYAAADPDDPPRETKPD